MDKKRRLSDVDGDGDRDTVTPARRAVNSVNSSSAVRVVLVEPFYGGSHKQLIDLLVKELLADVPHAVCSLAPRKWHWRLMAASLSLSSTIPCSDALRVLFVTSMVNLAELLGLRPDLNVPSIRKIYYFHENQLTYPYQTPATAADGSDAVAPRKVAAEDFHIGWSQVLSCLAADELVFNSDFNRQSFLSRVEAFINKIPEQELRLHGLRARLERKSKVLYFPLVVPPPVSEPASDSPAADRLTIVWNHRWEYDKNPDEFFQTLFELDDAGCKFNVVVLGESFGESPHVFQQAKERLEASANAFLTHWGFAPTRERYFALLRAADVVISTSHHEFYGVAVLEAVLCGCYPLVPNRLVYPEFFGKDHLFNTQRQLFKKLKYFCGNPRAARAFRDGKSEAYLRHTWLHLRSDYDKLLLEQ
ncbi:hypothetical protein PINS_up000444 [Pythium insidiosum]|nr:hypothetical protein PINS_up000444 [Pythium insidiosum]